MDTNLTTQFATIQIDRARLTAQAERRWAARQAIAEQRVPHRPSRARRWAGGLVILAGQRLQGLPTPALPDLQPGTPA